MQSIRQALLLGTTALVAIAFASAGQAAVEISSKSTQNMNCSGGVCAPTAANAVLNVSDLETMLASGNVTITTTGSGVQADDIDVDASASWSTKYTLTIDAYRSIAINQPISVNGLSGMSLVTSDGGSDGTLWFSSKGHITFKNLSSALSINGADFMLASDIKTLASDIAENPAGDYALATSYNAKSDGTYSSSPLPGISGTFTGLGNTVSNLSIDDGITSDVVGLFKAIYSNGKTNGGAIVEHLKLQNIAVTGPSGTSSDFSGIGAIAGSSNGVVFNDTASGTIAGGEYSQIGGLVGVSWSYEQSAAEIEDSSSSATVSAGTNSNAGGLAGGEGSDGQVTGTISQSYATGAVSSSGGSAGGNAGGLIAWTSADTSITNSYATGSATGANIAVGGLIGNRGSSSTVSYSYSTGAPSGSNSCVGGLIGYDSTSGGLKDTYWDTTTSGITSLSQGTCNVANDPGIKGLSSTQFKAKLPKGFSKSIWKESSKLNGGLPYLVANPPAK